MDDERTTSLMTDRAMVTIETEIKSCSLDCTCSECFVIELWDFRSPDEDGAIATLTSVEISGVLGYQAYCYRDSVTNLFPWSVWLVCIGPFCGSTVYVQMI